MRNLTRFACAVVVLSFTFVAAAAPGGKLAANSHECFYRDAVDGCTLSATSEVNIFGCESEGYYMNVHRVLLSAALTYTFSVTAMDSGNSPFIGVSHEDSEVWFVTKEGSRGGTATVTYKPPADDFYEIYVGAAERFATGSFRLTGSCQTAPPVTCTQTSTTVCLMNGRFRVSIDYRNQFANPPTTGPFVGAKHIAGVQNPDVAVFGLGTAQAIEVVVRVQDARPFAPRFDIYYGGLTDLEYTVSVTDTVTGKSKTYRNLPGTVGGGVDRTTFPAN